MKNGRMLLTLTSALLCMSASLSFAQKVKSQKEAEGIQAIQSSTTVDDQVKKIDEFLTNFADSEFKIILLQRAVQLEESKGDYTQTTIWAERLLQANPKDVYAEDALASGLAMHTREFDLDKDEKLAKAEKYAKDAMENIKTFAKPIASIPDDQWEKEKKNLAGEAHASLGLIAMTRKNYDGAIAEFKTAIDVVGTPDANTTFRLGEAYLKAGKTDDAIAQFDKVLSMPEASAQVKQYAQQRKTEASKLKAPPAAAPPPKPQQP